MLNRGSAHDDVRGLACDLGYVTQHALLHRSSGRMMYKQKLRNLLTCRSDLPLLPMWL